MDFSCVTDTDKLKGMGFCMCVTNEYEGVVLVVNFVKKGYFVRPSSFLKTKLTIVYLVVVKK